MPTSSIDVAMKVIFINIGLNNLHLRSFRSRRMKAAFSPSSPTGADRSACKHPLYLRLPKGSRYEVNL